jgi:hypothetical protein
MQNEIFKQLIFDCDFIARVPIDARLNVKTRTYSHCTFLNNVFRMFSGENKKITTNFIETTLNRVFMMIEHQDRHEPQGGILLREKLNSLKNGIQNLLDTYNKHSPDPDTLSALNLSIGMIDIKKEELAPCNQNRKPLLALGSASPSDTAGYQQQNNKNTITLANNKTIPYHHPHYPQDRMTIRSSDVQHNAIAMRPSDWKSDVQQQEQQQQSESLSSSSSSSSSTSPHSITDRGYPSDSKPYAY